MFSRSGKKETHEKQRDYRRPVMRCYLVTASIHWCTTEAHRRRTAARNDRASLIGLRPRLGRPTYRPNAGCANGSHPFLHWRRGSGHNAIFIPAATSHFGRIPESDSNTSQSYPEIDGPGTANN